ncbi:hypothetical protein E4634_05335 [Mangrovimicrobium sediminis]|uniref:Uncharacterized protein n=1 Tax=Mangrovimicrobium sediminis TaxID=2562682 RepID=A0A4Z0M5P8_9GAMM|nr:hypothetical protein [Haliea sp. SAOS-164]TGD74625.1 hypothetical protein E4634_05335 [Haliea sp. SAOS-164]
MNKLSLMPLWPALLFGAVNAHALSDDFQFQGFLSQGVIYSPDNPFFDKDTGLNFNYREVGLNGSWTANDRVRLAGQVLSRRAGDLDDGDPKIDFLLLDYNFYIDEAVSAGIRLGRVKTHYGLYNTSRDIPHGRPGVFAPQSIYYESMRGALISLDGADLYATVATPLADISLNAFGGTAHFDNQAVEYQLFQSSMPGKFRDIDGGGFQVMANPRPLPDLTLGYTYIGFVTEYEDGPSFTPAEVLEGLNALKEDSSLYPLYVTNLELEASIHLFSAQYSPGDWIFTAEHMIVDVHLDEIEMLHLSVPKEIFPDKYKSKSVYLQAEWQAMEKLSLYTRWEKLLMNEDDPDGSVYEYYTGGNPVTQYNEAYTAGSRWYFTPDFSATAEYSINEGAAFLNGQSDIDYSSLNKHWDLFLLQFSYHF